MNQAYSRFSTTHGHITDCKLLVCMYWTSLVLVRLAASLYSASPLKHHPTGIMTLEHALLGQPTKSVCLAIFLLQNF